MGLDITVRCDVNDVIENLSYHKEINQTEALRVLTPFKDKNCIDSRPGSYGGLHRVREAFTRINSHEIYDVSTRQKFKKSWERFHLLNHSDAEGWYLPEDWGIQNPLWINNTSIGSSYNLMKELETMIGKIHPDIQWSWDAIYVAAVASVLSNNPIKFH